LYPEGHFGFAAVIFLVDAPLTQVMVEATALVGLGLTATALLFFGSVVDSAIGVALGAGAASTTFS
jgi:hypothetical protein